MFLDKYEKTKEKAISKANEYFNLLQQEISENQERRKKEYYEQLTTKEKENITVFNDVVLTPKEFMDFLYNDGNFKSYLQYAIVIKNIERKISLIQSILILIPFVITILSCIITKNIILSIIIGVILFVIVAFIGFRERDGNTMTYQEYYMRTMPKLMISILPGYRFDEMSDDTALKDTTYNNNYHNKRNVRSRYYLKRKLLENETLSIHFSKMFDSYKENNTLFYKNSEVDGGMCDLEIICNKEKTNKETGKTEIKQETIFDGFFIKNNILHPSKALGEYIIEIREDENLFSALTEDTVHSIYKSEKEFAFNAEELNKALDCKIKYESLLFTAAKGAIKYAKKAITKDSTQEEPTDPTFMLEQIITPALEEHLLYLRKRYNSFNMNLANSYISFNVNLEQSFFQKLQGKEVFGNGYKNHTQHVTFIKPTLSGLDDFKYCKVFPVVEKLFFTHYINLLYRFALKQEEVTTLEINLMDQFEEEMAEILSEKYSDFKERYKDDLEQISNMVKDSIQELEAE